MNDVHWWLCSCSRLALVRVNDAPVWSEAQSVNLLRGCSVDVTSHRLKRSHTREVTKVSWRSEWAPALCESPVAQVPACAIVSSGLLSVLRNLAKELGDIACLVSLRTRLFFVTFRHFSQPSRVVSHRCDTLFTMWAVGCDNCW